MAQDDMYVIMYKILAYLYDCMKNDVKPDINKWDAEAFSIPETYWTKIVKELVDHGLIDGVNVMSAFGGKLLISPYDPKVTMEGVQFAQENSMMAKAAKFLRDAKASIPFI